MFNPRGSLFVSLAVAGAVFGSGCGLFAKDPFEGELRLRMTADRTSGDAVVSMKGPAVRFALAELPSSWVLIRIDQRAVSAVDDTTKTAMELTLDDVEKAFDQAGWRDLLANDTATTTTQPSPTIEKTGGTDTVAGRSCDLWRVGFPDGEVGTICVADLGAMPWSSVVGGARIATMLGTDRFPLRAVVTGRDGRVVSSLEVVSIDARQLDDAHFMIPASYTTVSLGGVVREVSAALDAFADRVTAPPRSAQPLNAPVPPPSTATTSETDYGAMFDSVLHEIGTVVKQLQTSAEATPTATPPMNATVPLRPVAPTPAPAPAPPTSVNVARALADLRCQLQESGQGAFGILCLNPPAALTCVDVLGATYGQTWVGTPSVRLLYTTPEAAAYPDVGGGMRGHPCSGIYDATTRTRIAALPTTTPTTTTPTTPTTPTTTPPAPLPPSTMKVCKGLTFRVLGHEAGSVYVRVSDPQGAYAGDTLCSESRPLLCFHDEKLPRPAGLTKRFDAQTGGAFYSGWSGGSVKATPPMKGTMLGALDFANSACASHFGAGWRMAEFHDGKGGWGFIAKGQLNPAQQYWVHIKDQPANPWNSAR